MDSTKKKKEVIKPLITYLILTIITFLLVCGFLYLSAHKTYGDIISRIAGSDYFLGSSNGINQINNKVRNIRTDSDQKYLLLGDSVANQIFQDELWEDYNPLLCEIASNQATTMMGQYMLLCDFLDKHETVEDVWLLCCTDSLSFRDYDNKLTYNYLIAPFSGNDLYTYVDPADWDELGKACVRPFGNEKVAKFLCKSEVCLRWYLEAVKDKHIPCFNDDLGYKYLIKMNQLCQEKGVRFHILPAPEPNPSPEEFLKKATKILEDVAKSEGLEYGDNVWSLVKDMDYSEIMEDSSTFNKVSYALLHTPFCPPEIFKDGSHFDEDHESFEFFQDNLKNWYNYDSMSEVFYQNF